MNLSELAVVAGVLAASAHAAPSNKRDAGTLPVSSAKAPSANVRIVGHGLGLAPHVPFMVTRPPAGPALQPDGLLLFTQDAPKGRAVYLVALPKPGPGPAKATSEPGLEAIPGTHAELMISEGEAQPKELGSFGPGPELGAWQIELGGRCRMDWIDSFALQTGSNASPLELTFHGFGAHAGISVMLSGTYAEPKIPDIDDLAGPNEQMQDKGKDENAVWAELAYEQKAEKWVHRVYYLATGDGTAWIVSARAPAAQHAVMVKDADTAVSNFKKCRTL